MAKRERSGNDIDVTVDMDMTPMIDMVFQMVMFFIIITDFTQQEIALLELPWSTVGQDDEGEDTSRIVINITAPLSPEERAKAPKSRREQADQIIVQKRKMTFVQLTNWLKERGVKDTRYLDPEKKGCSSRSLLIRCDSEQAFDYVKGILQVCSLPEVAIYKIEIATSEKAK